MKKNLFYLLLALCFFFLLCFPQESFAAAKNGLLLWSATLVPTLLPVMILSRLLLETNLALSLARIIAPPFAFLLGISPAGVYALLVGFFCGCPMGVKVIADLRQKEQISRTEACYLATFCNNISPAFVIHFLVMQHLKEERLLLPTLCILLGTPFLYALLTRFRTFSQTDVAGKQPAAEKNKTSATAVKFAVVDACITDSIRGVTNLGGYVILFAVFTAMIKILPLQTPLGKAVLTGLTEISTGIQAVSLLNLPFRWKYLLLILLSAFGGLCCAAQSAQMLARIGLPLRSYLKAKLMVTAIALILAICYVM